MNQSIQRARVVLALAVGGIACARAWAQAPVAEPIPPSATAPAPETRFSRSAEAEILFQEAQGKYYRNELAAAETSFRQLTQEDPADTLAWYFLGLSQLDQGKYTPAAESFTQTLRLDPTLTEARAARAKAYVALREHEKARADIAEFENDPKWRAQAAYLKGQIHYARGEWEQASAQFEIARREGGIERESAEFYQGLTYLQMRDLVRAREVYREAGIGGADRDPTVAAASRQLDDVLAGATRTAETKPWEVQLTASYEYDTNVLLLGSNVALPTEISDDEDGRFVLQPRGSYSIFRGRNYDAGLEATGYFSFQDDIQSFNIFSYQGGPFANYRVGENLWLSGRYSFNYIEFGHEKYLTRHLVTPQVTWVEKNRNYISAYYQYQNNDFTEQEGTPFDRDGNNHVIGIVRGINLPSPLVQGKDSNLELSYRFTYQDTQGDEYEGLFHTVGAVYYTPLPLWNLRLDVGATVTFEDYRNPSAFDADGDERSDFEYVLSVGLTRELFKNASIRVDYAYTNRDSNVETFGQAPFEYDRSVLGVRFIYSY